MTRRTTVRARLTLLYTGLFLATATGLLAAVNLLLQRMLAGRVADVENGKPPPVQLPTLPTTAPDGSRAPVSAQHSEVVQAVSDLRDAVLRFQWGVAPAVVVVLTLLSAASGWWLSGRLLRRLHRITATAQELSASTLDRRIALAGPADEFKELADTFDAMLERLERSADSQRRFVANASHELRTPLAIQRAAIQIGLDDPTPQQLAEVRERLLDANRRTERLIDGLLMLARSEHGPDTREPVPFDALLDLALDETPAPGLTMTVDAAPLTVDGDPVLLARLVANLLDNAVRYNRPAGTVAVRVDPAGALSVTNTGPVVPDDRVGELFQPFRRLPGPARQVEGAGLGLSIVAAIARAHGGTVTAQPNPGGGLCVTVRLPPGIRPASA